MKKKILSVVIAMAMIFVPLGAFAESLQHVTFENDTISIDISHEVNERSGIVLDYIGTNNDKLRMHQVFLVYDKNNFYMTLDYVADNASARYDTDTEESAMKMYKEAGLDILKDDLLSSGAAQSAKMEEPEYFEAKNGKCYVKQAMRADGSKDVNMIAYMTCSANTVYEIFVVHGALDKKNEQYVALDAYGIEDAEAVIDTYEDNGFDKLFLEGKHNKKGMAKGAGKYAIAGLIIGVAALLLFGSRRTGKLLRKKRDQKKGVQEDPKADIPVMNTRSTYADRGKNPNAKKGRNHNREKN